MPEAPREAVAVRAKDQTPDFQRALPTGASELRRAEGPRAVRHGGRGGTGLSQVGRSQATAASRHHSPSHLCCVPQKPSSPSSPRPPTEPDVPPHLTDDDTEAQKAAVISPGHVGWSARPGPESGLPMPRHQGLFPMEQTRSPEHTERATTGLLPGQDPGGQLDIADTSRPGEGGKCLYLPPGPNTPHATGPPPHVCQGNTSSLGRQRTHRLQGWDTAQVSPRAQEV